MKARWDGSWPSNRGLIAGGQLPAPSACGRRAPRREAGSSSTWGRTSWTRLWCSSANRKESSAEVVREKEGPGVNDAFTIRLRYPGLMVTLGANSLSLPAAPRFHLRGTKGSYWKYGVDPQEAALNKITRID